MADALRLARRMLRRARLRLEHAATVRDPCGLVAHQPSRIARLARQHERQCRRIQTLPRTPTVAEAAMTIFRKTYVKGVRTLADGRPAPFGSIPFDRIERLERSSMSAGWHFMDDTGGLHPPVEPSHELPYAKGDSDLHWVDPPVVHNLQQRALEHEWIPVRDPGYTHSPVERVNVRDHIVLDGVKMTFEEVLARPDLLELVSKKDDA